MDYKEKLEEAKRLYESANADQRYVLESLFPELSWSEDERIRKVLIAGFADKLGFKWYGLEVDDILSWLEKQGEQKPFDYENANIRQKDFAPKSAMEAIKEEKVDNANKVGLKFKVGDWIINRTDATIMRVINNTDFYESVEIGGQRRTDTYNYVEWDFRLWTIQDAKDGDVLTGKIDGDSYILIYKQIKDGWIETYGHYYDSVDRFCVPSQLFCRDYQGTLTPATKEQRDLLFIKMHEAGYEWDADKKELKLLITNGGDFFESENCEQKSAWSKEDELKFTDILALLRGGENCHYNTPELFDWLKSIKQRLGGKL